MMAFSARGEIRHAVLWRGLLTPERIPPQELLQFCSAVLNHSPHWIKP
jgi:hypothetical protein